MFLADLANIKTGWFLFMEGQAPQRVIAHASWAPSGVDISLMGTLLYADGRRAQVSCAMDTANHRRAVIMGTAGYMSPEQARGKPVNASADLFALGVVLWELLTGKRLFAGETDAETLERVTRCELPPLSEHRGDLPPDLEPILRRALSRDHSACSAAAGADSVPSSSLWRSSVTTLCPCARSKATSASTTASSPPACW